MKRIKKKITQWEEKEKLKKAIIVDNLKNEEHDSDRVGLRRKLQSWSKDVVPKCCRDAAVTGSFKGGGAENSRTVFF